MLSPSYCYAEGWDLPFEPKILVREKACYFNVEQVKHGAIYAFIKKLINKVQKVISRIGD